MDNTQILLLLWVSLAAHVAVAIAVLGSWLTFAWIPGLNALVSGAIVGYWLQKWYSYLFHGIRWNLTDQWIPAYGLAVLLLSAAYALGRNPGNGLHHLLFGLHGIVLLAAAVFFSTFKMDRLF